MLESVLPSSKRLQVRRWHLGMVVFLAGYHAFQNIWLHLLWFGVTVALPYFAYRSQPFPRKFPPFLKAAGLFCALMLLVSLRPGLSWWRLPLALGDTVLFLLFLHAAYQLGHRRERVRNRTLEVIVITAGVTALISFLIFYFLPGKQFPKTRLENVVVHFGLAPVLTGMLFASAGLTAAILACRESNPRSRRHWLGWEALLLFAALCAQSRGAVLAFLIGLFVLIIFQFHKKLLAPLAVILIVGASYQWLVPMLTAPKDAGIAKVATPNNPAKSMVGRKDAGRFKLYEIILNRMNPPLDYVIGSGRWANDEAKPPEQHWHAHHPHSVYLATFYRGGALGLLALGAVMIAGLLPCLSEARAGRPAWLVLAFFGMAAFVVDGDDLTTLASMPRVEPLLFWFPLAAGAGAAARERLRA